MKEQRLRDLKKNTELLILIELIRSPSTRLKDIAEDLDITVQAVSQYIAEMKKEELLKEQDGKLRPTRRGMQIALEHFIGLKDQIDSILKEINAIDRCAAIAGEKIEEGDSVGLVMENGMLMAYPQKEASSVGMALESAEKGDDILVGQLEGIVDMELGSLLVIEAASELEGGSKKANIAQIKAKLNKSSAGLLVAGDAVGASILMKIGRPFIIHAPIESTMSALCKGVDVIFCGARDSTVKLLQAVIELKKSWGYEVKWKTLKL